MKYSLIHSETIHQGRIFDLRVDTVELPDGQSTRLDIIRHPGAVVVLPLDAHGNILFVRQYRHAAGVELLELPAGALEVGEEPQDCALREIREETGMAADELRKIGDFYLAPGYSTEHLHIYLASKLRPDPLPGDEDEFLSVESIPVGQAYTLAEQGEIKDAKTLASLMLAHAYLA